MAMPPLSSFPDTPLVIGIDVGGTNTDAVAFRGNSILSAAKVPSTSDFASGVARVVSLLDLSEDDNVSAVFCGTTAFVNALLEGRGLTKVAVVRLCSPSARRLLPLADFPMSLKDIICAGTWFASGGLYFDGKREELAIDEDELKEIASKITKTTAEAVVVSGTFSPCNSKQEERAAEILRQHLPSHVRVVISSLSGRLGLLSRENAAVLNATLFDTAQRVALCIQQALRETGLLPPTSKFFFTANDGSVISFQEAAQSPLQCVACGPANSLRGAAFLDPSSTEMDRIVLDVGGTSTDAGCLVGGVHPRRANAEDTVAGVHCNQRTTDVVSIALGGGSIVSSDGTVGPESLGVDISQKALCFGGSVCTATCLAVARGIDMMLGSDVNVDSFQSQQPLQKAHLDPDFVTYAWGIMQRKFLDLVERTRTDASPVEVLIVGGAAGLVDEEFLLKRLGPTCRVARPKNWSSVANACGSALTQSAGEVEAIVDLSCERENVLKDLKQKACSMAGRDANVTECEEVPLAYLPGKLSRVYVRAVAPLDLKHDTLPNDDEKVVEPVPSLLERPPALRQPGSPPVTPSLPNVKNGVWTVSEYDAMCLSIGCGVLGCGGGGSTRHAFLQLSAAIREGQPIRVISANCVPEDAFVAPCAIMGAPTVFLEMIGSPDCMVAAISRNLEVASTDKNAVFIMLSEVGGGNGLMPLLVGGMMDRPVVDADLMGRAFPELQMTTTAIGGCSQTPMTASDAFGRCVCLTSPSGTTDDDLSWTERVLRPVCVEFGCSAGLADPLIRGRNLLRVTVLGSLTRARRIGDCILRSAHPKEAIDKLLQSEGGKLLFVGKVSDIQRETTAGFAKGSLTVLGEDSVSSVVIEFQNEFLVARQLNKDGKSKMIGCVPDILSLLDVDSARPIATEEVRFGFRVCLLLLPVSHLLRTPEALRVVGPGAFGLGNTYESILDAESSMQEQSIADISI